MYPIIGALRHTWGAPWQVRGDHLPTPTPQWHSHSHVDAPTTFVHARGEAPYPCRGVFCVIKTQDSRPSPLPQVYIRNGGWREPEVYEPACSYASEPNTAALTECLFARLPC